MQMRWKANDVAMVVIGSVAIGMSSVPIGGGNLALAALGVVCLCRGSFEARLRYALESKADKPTEQPKTDSKE